MRNAFAKEMFELADLDDRVILLMADIGNRLFNDYRAKFPDRFYNCGVAESNMISLAAGMASEGLRPFCYTITPFVTARCLEQIRVDVCYHQQPVTIVGTGSGLSYASLGATHHSCEDIATMRALPEMVVMAPADAMEVRGCLRAALDQKHPAYLRIGKKGEPVVHEEVPKVEIGKAIPIREGAKTCILSTGNMLPASIEATDRLDAALFSHHTVKPLDEALLERAFGEFDRVVTVEEHSAVGGFGSAVAEWLADQPERPKARLIRIAARDEFLHETTNQTTAREIFGLTADAIVSRIEDAS